MSEEDILNFDEFKLKKMKELIKMGHDVYKHEFKRGNLLSEIREKYENIEHDKSEDVVVVAGYVFTIRQMGKVIFADLKDDSGKIQLFLRQNDLGEQEFKFFKDFVETSDIIGVKGNPFRTRKGELSIWVNEYEILTKSICPLPEKYHGLKDVSKRYRQRYVDLKINDDVKEIFRTRSKTISLIRSYLDGRGFLEFETPILQPIYGGANARPFTTYHNFLKQDLFLRIAPELYLKRLIIGGFEKVYEIAKNFRNEDIDTTHNPEFTLIEVYEAYKDYNDMMELTEDIIMKVVDSIFDTPEVKFGESVINFKKPWKRISMEQSVKEHAGIAIYDHSMDELRSIAEEQFFEDHEKATTLGEMLIVFFENLVEKNLEQPTFIYDYPIENSPLAKKHRTKEGFAERFELFINGWELANGFSELNDPLDQKERFEAQDKKRKSGDLEAQMIDLDYINALGYGMPPTGGIGIGIDRLVMLMTNNSSIKEVILFPQMKTLKKSDESKDEESIK